MRAPLQGSPVAVLLEQATEATLATYPGGIIDRVVKLSNGEYEVHNIGVDWPHHIFVTKPLQTVRPDLVDTLGV